MTVRWLRGSYAIAPAPRAPQVVVLVDEDTHGYDRIDIGQSPEDVAVEVRATEMGPARTDPEDLVMITALITDLAVNLTASAIWAGIVGAVRSVIGARRPRRDAEQRFILTVIIPTSSGERVVESEAVGEGSVEAGLATIERIVSEILATTASR